MCRPTYLPLPVDLPLVVAMTLAPADSFCGLWLAAPGLTRPFPLQLATPSGWRALLIGADLGALLGAVEAALVDTEQGPRCIPAPTLRAARTLELDDGLATRLIPLRGAPLESLLLAEPVVRSSRIRYLG
jgi:hypothetical protein